MEYINEENSPGVMEWYRAMIRLNQEEGLFPELDDVK